MTLFLHNLEIGQLYAIAGNSQKVGLCQYIKEYSKMTQVEKRGIAGAYKKGCGCEVSKFLKNLRGCLQKTRDGYWKNNF